MRPFQIFIGYDQKESVAYHVCAHSIIKRASIPISINPIALHGLKGIHDRGKHGTTEFAMSRFLTPYLSNYQGYSLFMDCDMLVLFDIAELQQIINAHSDCAVICCQHNYTPKTTHKATGEQTVYPRKNWSSVMIFNNKLCKGLTPEFVDSATGAQLHQMGWAKKIGSMPLEYNWLVSEYVKTENPKILHYTLGCPNFEAYKDCDYAQEWFDEFDGMMEGMAPGLGYTPRAVLAI